MEPDREGVAPDLRCLRGFWRSAIADPSYVRNAHLQQIGHRFANMTNALTVESFPEVARRTAVAYRPRFCRSQGQGVLLVRNDVQIRSSYVQQHRIRHR